MASLLNKAKAALGVGQPIQTTANIDMPPSIRAYFDAVNAHDVNAFAQVFAPNVIGYGFKANGQTLNGAVEMVDAERRLLASFPDVKITPTFFALDSSGTWVFLRQEMTGTNTGICCGGPPTSLPVNVQGQAQIRLDGTGRIAEFWLGADHFAMYQQLGLIPAVENLRATVGTTTTRA